jgi:hypothetical protein
VKVFFAIACLLSSTLSILGGIRKRGLQAIPNVAQNFHDVSVRPGHERNLLQPDFTAHRWANEGALVELLPADVL